MTLASNSRHACLSILVMGVFQNWSK